MYEHKSKAMNYLKSILLLLVLSVPFSTLEAQVADGSDDANFAAYSNFDFIPGKKVLFYDDFATGLRNWKVIEFDAADDVESPGLKNLQNDGTVWFKTPRKGMFFPLNVARLPEEFTLEFDMWADTERMSEMEGGLSVILVSNTTNREEYNIFFDENPQIQLDVHPSMELLYCIATRENGPEERVVDSRQINNGWEIGKSHRISISRNKTHIRLYVNEKKFIDLPNGLPVKGNYTLILHTNLWGDGLYFSNFRLAEGLNQPTKLDNEGKFVTNAIYFNVNSATIEPESWAALGQAAAVIQSATGNITIIGHTDSDGNEDANLVLSKKRAESVRQALVKHFGIEEGRLLTDGKGESLPVDKNETAEGKANNRRVEFVLVR